eukprot:330176-Prorocentrum_lima.AAC.1
MKGPRPKDQHTFADPVPPGKFADTRTWVKGIVKGKIAIVVDDLLQAENKASNMEFLKALEKHWSMSTPKHLGPQDPDEKLKFIGVMITRATAHDAEYPEGSMWVKEPTHW